MNGAPPRGDDELLRSVALQNASSILRARMRAEEELLEAKEALRASEERLRATFNQAAVGIVIADMDGRYLEMNRKFCEILGYAEDELRGMTLAQITHPEDLERTEVLVRDLVAGRIDHYALEKRYLRRGGSLMWGRATVTLLRDAAGQANRFVGVIEDISQRKQAEEALVRAAEERRMLLESERHARAGAERANRMKDEFLATLSHELRTPLSAILGWAHLLRSRTPSEAEMRKGLEIIERNARMQTQLIEDLLDMSRITSGKIRLDVQPLMPASFVEAALETVRPAAEAKGIQLQRVIDPAAGPVSGDPGRLQQVVWNLLSNAIKFTPRGGKVQVVLERVNSHAEISVADTGVGIDPAFLDHVFERFRQADPTTTRHFGGLGLGLAIVRHLIELHGGTVRAHSAGAGRGATFTVHLPVAAVQRPEVQQPREHPRAIAGIAAEFKSVDLSGVRVLVVDDQLDARELVERILGECGAQVITAGDARQALTLVERERPDVLVSDIGMPEVDGFELLKRVRALGGERGGKVPAIALTAFARSEDRTRALHRGFQVHVSKPVEAAELIATVASVAGRTTD
jgi:PAS domain S-box-containing protein